MRTSVLMLTGSGLALTNLELAYVCLLHNSVLEEPWDASLTLVKVIKHPNAISFRYSSEAYLANIDTRVIRKVFIRGYPAASPANAKTLWSRQFWRDRYATSSKNFTAVAGN